MFTSVQGRKSELKAVGRLGTSSFASASQSVGFTNNTQTTMADDAPAAAAQQQPHGSHSSHWTNPPALGLPLEMTFDNLCTEKEVEWPSEELKPARELLLRQFADAARDGRTSIPLLARPRCLTSDGRSKSLQRWAAARCSLSILGWARPSSLALSWSSTVAAESARSWPFPPVNEKTGWRS